MFFTVASLSFPLFIWTVEIISAAQALPLVEKLDSPLTSTMEWNEPNPPQWPESVKIFHDTDSREFIMGQIQGTQDPWNEMEMTYTCEKHFSSERHALLFAPGVYSGIDFPVGYYVQVAGLGRSADQVQFVDCEKGPYVPALNKHIHRPNGTSLDTFWRSAENFYVGTNMQWAVSQAAPLRKVHVAGNLILHDGSAYASGGHLANCKIDGDLHAGGQQQFLVRAVDLGGQALGGAWSMTYVGCSGNVPIASDGNSTSPSITVSTIPVVRMEKPYIALKEDDSSQFELRVPLPRREGSDMAGPWINGQHEESRDFSRVRVVVASPTNTQDIQQALDQGKDLVLAPGIFRLERTLQVITDNQVILGLGLATLVAPRDGSPCIRVHSNVAGVRIGGIMLEATALDTESESATATSLLEWGDALNSDPGSAENPGGLFDIFCRVGGAYSGERKRVAVDYMMRLNSGHIIGDNIWLWRADHAILAPGEAPNYPHISPIFWQTEEDEFRVKTGLEVNGNNIHIFGLAVEHANGHQTRWNGESGSVHFYQSEFPYCVGHGFAESEFRGYLVGEHIRYHEVHAPGVYSNFRNHDVSVSTAMQHPDSPGVIFYNAFTVKLDNQGGIKSIVNGKGGEAVVQGLPVRM